MANGKWNAPSIFHLPFSICHRRRAFTLVELLVVIGIVVILISILLPLTFKARAQAKSVQCASNLRQIGAGLTRYFNDFHELPIREFPLNVANPHVFKYQDWQPDVSPAMEKYCGSGTRSVLFCPTNFLDRSAKDWWPYKSGTIAGTYQYLFWVHKLMWMIKPPVEDLVGDGLLHYRRLKSDMILVTDYLGVTVTDQGQIQLVAWNHEKTTDGSPRGMNLLFGDGHVEWRVTQRGWQVWGTSFGKIYWFYAK